MEIFISKTIEHNSEQTTKLLKIQITLIISTGKNTETKSETTFIFFDKLRTISQNEITNTFTRS